MGIKYEDEIVEIVKRALVEDIGYGDITTISVIGDEYIEASGEFLVKSDGIIAGLDVVWLVFKTIDPGLNFVPYVSDGDEVKKWRYCRRCEW